MKLLRTGAMALAASTIAAVALAHTGASGVVLERMNGMTALRDTMAQLAPMMQGTVAYNAITVSEGGRVMASHAGNAMLSLFPEGSIQGTTFAKPEIWSEWQRFAALAQELETYAEALAVAAPNALEPAAPRSDIAGMDHATMSTSPQPQVKRDFTVAELMGYVERAPSSPAASGTLPSSTTGVDLTSLAADDLFIRVSATCSSCHAQFRAGQN